MLSYQQRPSLNVKVWPGYEAEDTMINVQVGAFSHVPKNEPLHVWASEEES